MKKETKKLTLTDIVAFIGLLPLIFSPIMLFSYSFGLWNGFSTSDHVVSFVIGVIMSAFLSIWMLVGQEIQKEEQYKI